MNIDWVTPCRYVEIHDNLGTIVGAGIDTYWVSELPQTIQVVVAIRLTATAEEMAEGEKHAVTSRVRNPDGDIVSEMGGEVAVSGESANPEWLTGVMLPSLVQFEVTEEGTYTIDHLVDNAEASVPIHVVHGLPPGVEPEES